MTSIIPTFLHEQRFTGRVAGMDEAGRGPWAGPVVAAIVILNPEAIPAGLNDSKKLSASKREQLYGEIMASAHVGIGEASAQEIDDINILQATLLAMRRAYDALSCAPDVVLVDGNRLPKLPCAMEAIIGGDAASLSIAAASIIAKVTRDRLMSRLAQIHPQYGWERNAGYGTPAHQQGLAQHGICEQHRKSFAPIKKLILSAKAC